MSPFYFICSKTVNPFAYMTAMATYRSYYFFNFIKPISLKSGFLYFLKIRKKLLPQDIRGFGINCKHGIFFCDWYHVLLQTILLLFIFRHLGFPKLEEIFPLPKTRWSNLRQKVWQFHDCLLKKSYYILYLCLNPQNQVYWGFCHLLHQWLFLIFVWVYFSMVLIIQSVRKPFILHEQHFVEVGQRLLPVPIFNRLIPSGSHWKEGKFQIHKLKQNLKLSICNEVNPNSFHFLTRLTSKFNGRYGWLLSIFLILV